MVTRGRSPCGTAAAGWFPVDHEQVMDRAARGYLADLLAGRETLLLAGSNAEAADLARRVQAYLIALGRVGPGRVDLADGNMAGAGDLVRARMNTHIDAGGRRLTNRDTLRVTAVAGDLVKVQRRTGQGWTQPFIIPAGYLGDHAELHYAGNVHVAQGRTVGPSHLAVTPTLSRRSLLVGMTRGATSNTAYVETGQTAPKGKKPFEQARWEQVVAQVMAREDPETSATEQLRAGQEWAGGTGHVLHLWAAAVGEVTRVQVDRLLAGALTGEQYRRFTADPAAVAFHARVRQAQLAGHDVPELIGRVTADPLDKARSVPAVLHSRLAGLGLDETADVTWTQRTPAEAPGVARELAAGLDARAAELGVRVAGRAEPWAARHLGAAPGGGLDRAEWERRAGVAAAYREAAGITDPQVDVALDPHEGNPELETARKAAMRALHVPDPAETLRAMSRGELEAQVAEGDRVMAAAPPDVTGRLRAAGRAQGDAWAQSAAEQAAGRAQAAADAADLAAVEAARAAAYEPHAAAYEQWSASTAQVRDAAGRAKAELDRRDPPAGGPGAGSGRAGPGRRVGAGLVGGVRGGPGEGRRGDRCGAGRRARGRRAVAPRPRPDPRACPVGVGAGPDAR